VMSEPFVTRHIFFFLMHLCVLYDLTLISACIYTAFSAFHDHFFVRVICKFWLDVKCMVIKERAMKVKV